MASLTIMRILKRVLFILKFVLLITAGNVRAQVLPDQKDLFQWETLPPVPDSVGYAGSFAGVANDVLIVAGGSNFPNGGTPWNGGVKKWYDKIFVMEKPGAQWKEAGRLPFPLGYGVSVSVKNGLMLIGGSNEKGHVPNVFLLHYRHGKIEIENLPSLPFALANSCGALVGDKIFLAGGLAAPSSLATGHPFLCFDLKQKNGTWKELPAWPGPSRMLAVAGADEDHFYLFSGTQLIDGKRVYLTDAYSYSEEKGWSKLADLPHATVAAPSPAFSFSKNALFIFGGDTGTDAAEAGALKEKHPGFSKQILQYQTSDNTWSVTGEVYTNRKPDFIETPNNSIWAPVTTPLVFWKGQVVLAGGEVRPGTRTPNVLIAKPCQ
jgi:N-acetylneuraminate epimerase